MDGIITIVVIAIAIIFKVVEKKLKNSGGDEVLPTIPVPDGMDNMEQKPMTYDRTFFERIVVEEGLAEETSAEDTVVDEMVIEEAPSVSTPSSPILIEEEAKQKEKIDTKKLIIYSEIMKPKYME